MKKEFIQAPPACSTAAEFIPTKVLRDQQFSSGVQDMITFNSRLHATVGFSADHLKGLMAETYNGWNQDSTGKFVNSKSTVYYANIYLLPYQCAADPTNTSYSGCTAHFWNFNPQASVTYSISPTDVAFVTYEDRGRFPTLKQRYSSGMGSALPNPDLKTEHSQNWNIGYTHIFGTKLTADAELFRSDLRNAIESATVPDPGYTTNGTGLCPNNTTGGTGFNGEYCSQNINVGKETHEGLEIDLKANPISWLKLDTNYTYLNRTIGSAELPSGVTIPANSPLVLPSGIPKNKLIGSGAFRMPRQILGILTVRYEGGIKLQDTSYSNSSPLYQPYGGCLATVDLATIVPIRTKYEAQAGVRNLFDRNYFYTAGYPEEGRNWFLNLRYHF